jgi:mannose-6-phosphate isomerase-like protein (cupin superfamily)
MPSTLAGGVRVAGMREGDPDAHGALRIWPLFGRQQGADAISLRILELAGGTSPEIQNASCDEVLYVLEGTGTVAFDGHVERVAGGCGFYLRPGARMRVDNRGREPLVLASARCPDPGSAGVGEAGLPEPPGLPRQPKPFARLRDQPREQTGDRWYSVVVDGRLGSTQVTQFVGAIPPGRAPDHHHEYEEVLVILAGRGRLWAGAENTPIQPGSCVYLPRGQRHCVENTGDAELRLLGVFYPAGSPAVRYESR